MNRRDLVLKVFNNEEAERVPVGFWWHFAQIPEQFGAYRDDAVFRKVADGQKRMYDEFGPDFVKIMSDGFFAHPYIVDNRAITADLLAGIRSVGRDHAWIRRQVDLVNEAADYFSGEVVILYNIFSPVQQLRLYTEYLLHEPAAFRTLLIERTAEAMEAMKTVEEDTVLLVEELKKNTPVDGFYYSVQMLQHPEADEAFHDEWIVPSDMRVLAAINECCTYNMLHICGYEHYHNNVAFYKKYPCKSYNWATHTDNISMKEGKELFGTCVCGGFDNNKGTLIDTGDLGDLERETKAIIADAGRRGLILGADCTVPMDIDIERLKMIREWAR